MSPEELRYWNDNFKLPHHEAGLTPSKTTPMRPRGQQTTGESALSLTEWTAWQTPLQHVHFVNHSKRSRHFTEILEFCDFRRDCGDDDDSYDLEMRSFLHRDDILLPGEIDAAACVLEKAGKKTNERENGRNVEEIVVSDDGEMTRTKDGSDNMTGKKDSSHNRGSKKNGGRKRKSTDVGVDTDDSDHDDENAEEKINIARKKDVRNNINCMKEGSSKMAGKGKESSRKKTSPDFGSDIDDDFEDVLMNAPEKTAKVDQNQPHSDPYLAERLEKISPERKQLKHSHSLTKKQSEFADNFRKSQSKSGHTLSKNQSSQSLTMNQSESTAEKIRSGQSETAPCFEEVRSEVLGSDDDLSNLLVIPSSQRHRKVIRGRIPKGMKSHGVVSEALPDAPSLDTLLDLSALNAGEGLEDRSNLEEAESDHDFFPSMFTETPKTSKNKTHNNINKRFVQSCKVGLSKRKSLEEISENEGDGFDIEGGESSTKVSISKKSEVLEKANKSERSNSVDRCDQIEDEGSDKDKEGSLFGLGLVCDTGSRNKEDGVDFDFCQQLANSFFDDSDDDEIDRALCHVQTPCVFGDDEQTSNLQGCSEAQNIDAKKNNCQTPLLFDDDMFENMSESNHTSISKPERQHSSPKKLYMETENVGKKKHSVQTPSLFDDEEFENKRSEEQIMKPQNTNKHLAPRSLYSDVHDLSIKKKDSRKSIDEKGTTSSLQRKPLLEHNIDSKITNESRKLKTRMNEISLSRIRSFSFTKPDTDQSKSLKDMTSESRDEHLDIPDEYGHDVVAPTPYRMKPRASFFGKADRTRSFLRGESFCVKSMCNKKAEDNEIKTCQNRRKILKLKSKDMKLTEGVQVDAVALKRSPFGEQEKKSQNEGSPLFSQNMENKFTTKVCPKGVKGTESFSNKTKNDKHPSARNTFSLMKTSLPAKDQNKVEFHQPQVSESAYTSESNSFEHEFSDEEIDLICLSATMNSNFLSLCKEKNSVCKNKDETLKEKSLFKSPPDTHRKSSDGFKTCGLSETVSGGECREDFGEYVEDSPLVTKAKGKRRSKTLRNKLLESDEEYGDESSDNDGEFGEERQSEGDFQDQASVACTGSTNRRNQTKDVHEISDTDDQFDQPKKGKKASTLIIFK